MQIAHEHLAPAAHDWAEETRRANPHALTSELAESVEAGASRFARVNGAISGTPFLIALVPAYVSVLWEEARMVMRISALYGHDPRDPVMASELLALRGLYETPDDAARALAALSADDTSPTGRETGGVKSWARLVYRILILAGFVSAPKEGTEQAKPNRILKALSLVLGFVVFWITWVIPVTFMIAMSWSCESDTRANGSRAILYYGDERLRRRRGTRPGRLRPRDPGRNRRTIIRVLLLILSLGIPIAVILLAVSDPVGHSELYVPSAFIALMLVLAISVHAARR